MLFMQNKEYLVEIQAKISTLGQDFPPKMIIQGKHQPKNPKIKHFRKRLIFSSKMPVLTFKWIKLLKDM